VDASTLWWVITGTLVALELATGTFYLLMLALGAAAGALAAHAGLGETAQMATAAIVGFGAAAGWHFKRHQSGATSRQPLGTQADPDLALDLGQTVSVTAWKDDGSTQVSYRGAPWKARLQTPTPGVTPEPGHYRIAAMHGNLLLLEKA
jgi:membrane protein implicated in regulation of membrane protease activity